MLVLDAQTAGILDMARALQATGKKLPAAQALVLNRVLTRTRRIVVATMTDQTGLSRKIITKAVKAHRASSENPRAWLFTRGGEISLKYFGAREQDGGVVATVKGDRVYIDGGFRRSGPPGKRVLVSKLNGHVFINQDGGQWRGHIRKVRSGVFIPVEMIDGATRDAFLQVVERDLPAEVARELAKLLPGG